MARTDFNRKEEDKAKEEIDKKNSIENTLNLILRKIANIPNENADKIFPIIKDEFSELKYEIKSLISSNKIVIDGNKELVKIGNSLLTSFIAFGCIGFVILMIQISVAILR